VSADVEGDAAWAAVVDVDALLDELEEDVVDDVVDEVVDCWTVEVVAVVRFPAIQPVRVRAPTTLMAPAR
jgi:hypothetical protein